MVVHGILGVGRLGVGLVLFEEQLCATKRAQLEGFMYCGKSGVDFWGLLGYHVLVMHPIACFGCASFYCNLKDPKMPFN